jgi:outer membrane autotransporter protein
VGITVGGGEAWAQVPGRSSSANDNFVDIGAYGTLRRGPAYASAVLSYGHFQTNEHRDLVGASLAQQTSARGSYDSNMLGGRLEAGWRQSLGDAGVAVTPFAAVELDEVWQNAFTETDQSASAPTGLALHVDDARYHSLPTFLGAQLDGQIPLGALVLASSLRASWVHEFSTARDMTAVFVSAPGVPFGIMGTPATGDSALIETQFSLPVASNAALFAGFIGEFGDHQRAYGATGGFRLTW